MRMSSFDFKRYCARPSPCRPEVKKKDQNLDPDARKRRTANKTFKYEDASTPRRENCS